jgi:hypothetical protein
MFEKREKTPAFPPTNRTQPSLEAVMALQKMFEEGRLEQLEEASENSEAPPLEVRSPIGRAEAMRHPDAVQSVPWTIGGFFRNLAQKLHLTRKRPIGGRSASGNG